MGTESTNLPASFTCLPAVRVVSVPRWLRLLQDRSVQVDLGRIIEGPVAGGWSTQTRTVESKFETHYLFYSDLSELEVTTLKGVQLAPPQTVLWFPPAFPYALRLCSSQRRNLLRFRFQVHQAGKQLTPWTSFGSFSKAFIFQQHLKFFDQEMQWPLLYKDVRVRAMLSLMTTELLRIKDEFEKGDERLRNAQVMQLTQFVKENVRRRLAPADLAKLLGFSSTYFPRIFRKSFGTSPRRWIMETRIRIGAQMLIDSNLNVNEIAFELGYEDPHLFSRQFKTVIGVSPREYARRYHGLV